VETDKRVSDLEVTRLSGSLGAEIRVWNDFEAERVIQRVTIMGDQPEPAAAPRWQPFIGPLSAASRHDRQLQAHLSTQPDSFLSAGRAKKGT
jgi:hypothetical protein